MTIPVIDIDSLITSATGDVQVIQQINQACREMGFFYITGHGVPEALQQQLEALSRGFFTQDPSKKLEISMKKGGKAWRGYFPLKAELTSGEPDLKEGLYFGEDLPGHHPMVKAGVPLHGSNLYPDISGFAPTVQNYIEQMARVGESVMKGLALSLNLSPDYFSKGLMAQPIKLFRIFHYPPPLESREMPLWGVGEHTDYGVLTILKQDATGGLQVYTKERWIEAPYVENSFICNIGDMLDLMTEGYYRSTPHRVLNQSDQGRLSFPFFYDLDFNARPTPIDLSHLDHHRPKNFQRWDQSDLYSFSGSYGEYLVDKVSKVFPQLKDNVL